MTETEWIQCGDPRHLLRVLDGREPLCRGDYDLPYVVASDRKLLLFGCAYLRWTWPGSPEHVVSCETWADGDCTREEFRRVWGGGATGRMLTPYGVAWPEHVRDWIQALIAHYPADHKQQCQLIRHLTGDPFRAVSLCPHHYEDRPGGARVRVFSCPDPDEGYHAPHCLLSNKTVVKLADALYRGEENAFALSDALEEAGDEILAPHFRERQQTCRRCKSLRGSTHTHDPTCGPMIEEDLWHPKGCWALDLLLGKK